MTFVYYMSISKPKRRVGVDFGGRGRRANYLEGRMERVGEEVGMGTYHKEDLL